MTRLIAYPLTDKGRKRQNNEDFVGYFEPQDPAEAAQSGSLFVVADGVGGEAMGEKASQYTVQKLIFDYYQDPSLPPAERLKRIITDINSEIYRFSQDSSRMDRMATTIVAAVVVNSRLIVANVGDSRAYLVRDGSAYQITVDHSLVGERLRDREITEKQSLESKQKNRLTRAVGAERSVHVQVYEEIKLAPGDRIILCSDGLTRYALKENIAAMAAPLKVQEAVAGMVRYALNKGGADNITVLGVDIEPPYAEIPEGDGTLSVRKPVDWETMVTVHDDKRGKAKRRKKQSSLLLAVIAFLAILMIVAAGIYMGSILLRGGFSATITPQSPVMTGTATGLPVEETSEPIATPPADQVPAATQTPKPEVVPEEPAKPEPNPPSPASTDLTKDGLCIAENTKFTPINLGSIFSFFKLTYPSEQYVYFEGCTMTDAGSHIGECPKEKQTKTDRDENGSLIVPTNPIWIVIDGIDYQACSKGFTENKSIWIPNK